MNAGAINLICKVRTTRNDWRRQPESSTAVKIVVVGMRARHGSKENPVPPIWNFCATDMASASPGSTDPDAAKIPHSLPRGARASKIMAKIPRFVDGGGGDASGDRKEGVNAKMDGDTRAGEGKGAGCEPSQNTRSLSIKDAEVNRERTVSRGSSGSGGGGRQTSLIGKVSYVHCGCVATASDV